MLPKTYDFKPVEAKWAGLWQEKGLFLSKIPENAAKKSFVVVIPPPNITGALHMGHALNNTLQDVLIRSRRMAGFESYWVPGTDHGGIATQNVLEKMLKAEKKRREELGREKFLERMWIWYKECGGTILNQLKKLGCALDMSPSNVRFTMDATRANAVFEQFKRLWEKGLIYRGERMINWCVHCGTALSDIEVEHEQSHSKLWHIRYPFEKGSGGLVVATTRPETMLGDTAVAVNPEDSRYLNFVGKKLRLPLTDRLIPIIADEAVDRSFGTGAVKVTPAHDPADFYIGQRHGLDSIKVISFEGKMANSPLKYEGKDRTLARHEMVEDLRTQGLLEKEEPYSHAVGICYRCNQHIEPLVSEQWFVKMDSLAAQAIKAAEDGSVRFHPESWKKPYLDWLHNIQDWCISRQIWWGHRIPAWYCADCDKDKLPLSGGGAVGKGVEWRLLPGSRNGVLPMISMNKPEKCGKCGGHNFIQDPDVLDTWFSSALWPFSVFGWPEKTKELDYYYPTSVLVTGYEILYLWVARMVMAGMELTGKVPFSDVYVHGMVRDKHGKKMSKSMGNVVDPLVLMDKYGTDAVRFSLIFQAVPGRDIQFGEESITGARNFANKIYNAGRFVMMNLPERSVPLKFPARIMELSDRWIMDRYHTALKESYDAMETYDLAAAAQALYRFLWDDFCDWYVELSKPRLQSGDRDVVLAVLVHVLDGTMKALHPIMPYITEELCRVLKPYTGLKSEFLLLEERPAFEAWRLDPEAAGDMHTVMGVTTAIRTLRSQFGVPPGAAVSAAVLSINGMEEKAVRKNSDYVSLLARLKNIEIGPCVAKPAHSSTAVYGGLTIYVPLEGLIDLNKEKARLEKELAKACLGIRSLDDRLSDSRFMKCAPEAEVAKIRQRLEESASRLRQLEVALKDL
ncbi:MAG: valine--tRNA ligase [bacterium]